MSEITTAPFDKILNIFKKETAINNFIFSQIKDEQFQVALATFMAELEKSNPFPTKKDIELFKSNSTLLLLSWAENSFSKLILECYNYYENKTDVVADEKNIESYTKKTVETLTELLKTVEIMKKDLPEIKLPKIQLKPQSRKLMGINYNFNEPENDILELKRLNEINLRIFHYADHNIFSDPHSQNSEAIWLKSSYKKILRLREFIDKKISKLPEQHGQKEKEDEEENNAVRSTIDEYLEQFKTDIRGKDYESLINALEVYFNTGSFPTTMKEIKFGHINVKNLGWALKGLYYMNKTEKHEKNLPFNYLLFAKNYLSPFKDVTLKKKNFRTSNFYKYFTTKPQSNKGFH